MSIKNSLSKLARKIFTPDLQTLVEANYLTSDLKLTDDGKLALLQLIFLDKKADLVKEAEDRIARREEDAAKNKCC